MLVEHRPFVPSRLALARTFSDMTQARLAEMVGVSHVMISHLENGKKEPSQTLIGALSEVLGFETGFFYETVSDPFFEKECSFRHRRSAPEGAKARIRAHGTLIGMIVDFLRQSLRFPPYNVPQIRANTGEEIERAAEQCRLHWGLGIDTPVIHMGRALERAGVVIVNHGIDSAKLDAFSRYGGVSMVFLNTANQAVSRLIYDMAHEMGHLVMHVGVATGSRETEEAADRFGGAFLMPRKAFAREFSASRFSWTHIFDLKRRWQVSAAAILYRAYSLSLITADQYRKAFKHMSQKGWRRNEPFEPEPQEPELLSRAISAFTRSGRTLSDICRALHMTERTFESIIGFPISQRSNRVVPIWPR